jgi:hypothetical protein
MRASLSRRVRLVTAGGAVTLAVSVAPVGGAAQSEEGSAQSAAIGGRLTMTLDYPHDRDVVVIGVIANGRLHTPIICADFRAVRFKILNPPSGRPRFTPSPAYGDRDKTYSGGFLPPRTPGTYRYQAIAPRAHRARGLQRAVCAELRGPVRTVVVPPPDNG